MRILLVLGYYETGGFSTVINALATNMGELGHDVTVGAHTIRDKPPTGISVQKITPSKLKIISKKTI